MKEQPDTGQPNRMALQLCADVKADTTPAEAHDHGDGPVKWWRWNPQAGRWMPSEPPQGRVNTAYWCASDRPPVTSSPLFPGVHDGRRPSAGPLDGADAPLSSSSSG